MSPMPWNHSSSIAAAILVPLLAWLVSVVIKFRRIRGQYAHLPCPPHSFWWGHLKIMGEVQKELPSDIHYQQVMCYIGQKYNMPHVFYMDLWPFSHPLMMVHDPHVAFQVTQAKSLPKHPIVPYILTPLTGEHAVINLEGAEWKSIRSILQPGFATQYLSTLVPLLVKHGQRFQDHIARHAKNADVFPLQETAMALTFDIITEVVLGVDLQNQIKETELSKYFAKAALWAGNSSDVIRWQISRLPKWYLVRKQDRIIENMIRQRYAETKSTNRVGTKAAVDLFLHAYREEKIESSKKTRHADELDAEFVLLARNNVKTLLLGGHDTSSTSIAYTIALLSEPENRPELERVRAEHDEILGTDPSQAAAHLLSDPTLLGKLPLTTAAVKESLRMFPPATTTRTSPAPSKYAFHLSYPQTVIYNDTTTLPITGQQIWINSYGMGQRADLWPEPRKFKLDRFLPGTPQVKDAWRPFEKGPRGCIGLELAMMEMKLVLVLVLREFEFEIAYADDAPRAPLEHGLAGGRGYQVLEFAGKPAQHMPVKARRRMK